MQLFCAYISLLKYRFLSEYQCGEAHTIWIQTSAESSLRLAKSYKQQYIQSTCPLSVEVVQVLDDQLSQHDWLAADRYSIADMANFCWVCVGPFAGDYTQPRIAVIVD